MAEMIHKMPRLVSKDCKGKNFQYCPHLVSTPQIIHGDLYIPKVQHINIIWVCSTTNPKKLVLIHPRQGIPLQILVETHGWLVSRRHIPIVKAISDLGNMLGVGIGSYTRRYSIFQMIWLVVWNMNYIFHNICYNSSH